MATLLYVDDERLIGVAIARWFGKRGHTVHLAPTVSAAQQLLLTEPAPDLLFIDVWLGRESGFELMAWIEDHLPLLADRVTFVTGELADARSEDRLFRSLGRPVLQKPFDFEQLEGIVQAAEAATRRLPASPPDAERRAGT
jgi:DNA-binding response OmpR family regulator